MSQISKQALLVENNTNFPDNNTGYITPSLLREFNTDLIDSTVNQTAYNSFTASVTASIDLLNQFTASQQPTFTALNAFTASQISINSGVNAFTQSIGVTVSGILTEVDSLQSWSSSVNEIRSGNTSLGYSTRFSFGGAGFVTASLVSNVGGAIATVTINEDVTKLNVTTFNTYTSSNDSKWGNIASQSGSWITESETGSFARTTTENTFAENQIVNKSIYVGNDVFIGDDLSVSGSIVANNFSINELTASTLYVSGGALFNGVTEVETTLFLNDKNVGFQLNNLEAFTSSQQTKDNTLATYTASVDTKFTTVGQSTASINTFTASANSRLGALEAYTASDDSEVLTLQQYTASADVRFSGIDTTTASVLISLSNLNPYTSSNDVRWNNLSAQSSSFATTGSNSFLGNQRITGSTTVTGSVTITGSAYGNVVPLSIVSSTASMDMSAGNFFTLTLPSSSTTHIVPTNIRPGLTTSLRITTAQSSTVTFAPSILEPQFFDYTASAGANKTDILTFVAFDNSIVYTIAVNNLV